MATPAFKDMLKQASDAALRDAVLESIQDIARDLMNPAPEALGPNGEFDEALIQAVGGPCTIVAGLMLIPAQAADVVWQHLGGAQQRPWEYDVGVMNVVMGRKLLELQRRLKFTSST